MHQPRKQTQKIFFVKAVTLQPDNPPLVLNPQLKHPKSTLGAPLHSGSLLLCLLLHHRRQVEAEGLRAKIQ